MIKDVLENVEAVKTPTSNHVAYKEKLQISTQTCEEKGN